jgi:hypothetical protein
MLLNPTPLTNKRYMKKLPRIPDPNVGEDLATSLKGKCVLGPFLKYFGD